LYVKKKKEERGGNGVMKTERYDHMHAHAKDVEAVARFYRDVIGVEAIVTDWSWVGLKCCVIPSLKLEFHQVTDPEVGLGRLIANRPEGFICADFKVTNLDEAIAEMESRGIRKTALSEIGQLRQAWFEAGNTFGFQIELGEYPGDDIYKAARMPGKNRVEVGGVIFEPPVTNTKE
jgi:predicted enzyme related to lactoylglutathione lyase